MIGFLSIVEQLLKIVCYKPVKFTINAPALAKVIINVVVKQYGFFNSIVTNRAPCLPPNFVHLYTLVGIK